MQVASEKGYEGMTVSAIVNAARMSRKTFYELFDSCEDCFLAACEGCISQLETVVTQAYDPDREWRERLRSALTAALQFLESEPEMGLLALGHLLGVGTRSEDAWADARQRIAAMLEQGRLPAPATLTPSAVTAEMLIGGIASVVYDHLQQRASPLVALVSPLMSMVVLFYLGRDAATRELRRPAPKAPKVSPTVPRDPVRELGLRVTYRTARTIAVIAASPGSSNSEIALEAGISDAGQMSKLLARLARLGILENTGPGQALGGCNAWHLTSLGRAVNAAIGRTSMYGRGS